MTTEKWVWIGVAVLALFVGCNWEANERETAEWIKNAKKPVQCRLYGVGELGSKWTLIDSLGNIHNTGFVHLQLPGVIK